MSATTYRRPVLRRGKGHTDLFYPVLFGVTAFLVILLIAGLVILWGVLREYEDAQPKYVAEQVFSERFRDINYRQYAQSELDPQTEAMLPEFSTEEEKINYLNRAVSGLTTSYFRQSNTSDDSDAVCYTVKAGDLKLAEFSVVPTGETTRHGFMLYRPGSVTVYCLLNEREPVVDPVVTLTVKIVAQEGVGVSVNGIPLTEEYVTDHTKKTDVIPYAPDGFEGVPYATYTLEGLEELPEKVLAVSGDGTETEAVYDEESETYTVPFMFSETLKETHSPLVIEAAERFSEYMQAARGFSTISKYFDPDAPIYEKVKAIGADAWMVYRYESVEYKNVTTGECYEFPDGSVCCRVSFVMVGTRKGETSTDSIDYTFFLHPVGDAMRIYEFYRN